MHQCPSSQFLHTINSFCTQNQHLFLHDHNAFISQTFTFVKDLLFETSQAINTKRDANSSILTQTKPNKQITQMEPKSVLSQTLSMQSKLKYPISFVVVFLLTRHKQKPPNIILGFYYEIINHLVRELKKDLEDDKKAKNKKIPPEDKQRVELTRKIAAKFVLDGFQLIISLQKIPKDNQPYSQQLPLSLASSYFVLKQIAIQLSKLPNILKTSKVLKTLCCILCIPENYLPPSYLVQIFLNIMPRFPQLDQILQKIQYKLVNKLQKYSHQSFTKKDLVGLFKLLLFRFDRQITWNILDTVFTIDEYQKMESETIRPRHYNLSQTEQQQTFLNESRKKKVLKLIQVISNSSSKLSPQAKSSQSSFYGYHLTCFLVKIVSDMQHPQLVNPQTLFLKQLIIFLATNYLHELQSMAPENQSIKFYNTIISSMINENNIFVLKVYLNFIHKQAILGFSVDKLKSLFKLLTNIAKKLKKMDSATKKSSKNIKQPIQTQQKSYQTPETKKKSKKDQLLDLLINEQVELAKLKISRIIRIFDELTQKYRDKCQQLKFSTAQSRLSLQKMKQTNSVSFCFKLKDMRKSYSSQQILIQKTKFPKPFILQMEDIRLVKLVIAKTQTYEVYIKIKPSHNAKLKNSGSLIMNDKSAFDGNFFDQILLIPTNYTVQIIVCMDQNVLLEDQIKNVQKVADDYFQFTVCISCNKSERKGSKLLIKINEKFIEILTKQKRNQITSFELGSGGKSECFGRIMQTSVKQLIFFSKQVKQDFLQKNDFSSFSSSISHHLINLMGQQSINYRISDSPEHLIEDLKNQPKLFFKKQLKTTINNVTKSRTLTFIQIFEQIGGLNSIFYMLDKINKSYACHFGQKTQNFFVEIFKILKNLAANDKQNFIFRQLKRSYQYICHFLFLIFKRNQHLASQRNCHFIESIFRFLMFFSSYFTKDQSIKQYPAAQVLELELIFTKEVLSHFQLWFQCSLEIQSYVFQTLQNFIKHQKFNFSLFYVDLHSKILSSMTFFYSNDSPLKNKFQQRILSICEHLYDRIHQILDEKSGNDTYQNLSLVLDLLDKISKDKGTGLLGKDTQKAIDKKNAKQNTKVGLLAVLQGYIYRDINETIGLIYLLIIYHSKNYSQARQKYEGNGQACLNGSDKLKKYNPKNSIVPIRKSSSTSQSFISSNSQSFHLPNQLKTCSNLIAYFSKNFIEKSKVFSKIGDDWAYVLSIFSVIQQVLIETKIKSSGEKCQLSPSSCQTVILIKIYEIIFRIIDKRPWFYNYLVNSLQKLITYPGLSFLESFFLVSQILNINKKFSFDIVDTIIFLVTKKINSYKEDKTTEIVKFLNQPQLQKILYKMADTPLTYSHQFEDFITEICKLIEQIDQSWFSQQIEIKTLVLQQKISSSQRIEPQLNSNPENKIQLRSSQTIIDQFSILQKESLVKESLVQQQIQCCLKKSTKIRKSRQSFLKIFKDYEDTLFSICYETGSINQNNKQWIQRYFKGKFQGVKQDMSNIFERNILKEKRVNFESNLLVAHFCSSLSSVHFMFSVLQKLCLQQQIDAFNQEGQQKKQLSPIKQSPGNENTNSVSSRTGDNNFYIETQEKINEQIESFMLSSEPISFFLSNCNIQISAIHAFSKGLAQFQKSKLSYSFFSRYHSLSALNFAKMHNCGQAFRHLLEKYSHSQSHQNLVEKPVQAMKRTSNTLKALQIIKIIFSQKFIDSQGLYNCLLAQAECISLQNLKSTLGQIPLDKHPKIKKDLQTSLKKFLQTWYMNNSPTFKVNPHDRQKLKIPKKLNLDQKNLFDLTMDKFKFICFDLDKQQNQINQLFAFLNEQTKGNVAKQFLPLMNRIILTLKFVLDAKYIMTFLENHALFSPQLNLIGCPKNPAATLSSKIVEQYRDTIIKKFNKILQSERRKAERSETEFKKNEKENQFWLQIQEKDYEKKDRIFELDEKQIGVFGFYKLNIKPSSDSMQQIHYPRKKMFSEMKNSQSSGDNEQEDNTDDSVVLSRTRVLELSFVDNQDVKQRRNTLLQITPITSVRQTMQGQINAAVTANGVFWCQLVTKRGVYAGKVCVRKQYLEFRYVSHLRLPNEPVFTLSTGKFHQINSLSEQEQSRLSPLRISYKRCRLFTRRYILRHTAVELFSKNDHKSYFINFFWNHERQKFIDQVRDKFEEVLQDKQQLFLKKQFTEQWKIGTLSNFQYLCLINQYSGRSTNDLAQYYVFPWVITNYNGKDGFVQIDDEFLKHKSNLRNLAHPPGKLNEQKFLKLKTRLMELDFCQPQQRFLYGTMFSNPTVLYNFFIRLEPYIHLHWEHQGKRIDHADRLFSAIEEQFNSVLIASSDMKELTPQFYYWPQFLKNRSYIDLGQKQNKQQVDDVILPPWAHSPEQFIFKMRYVLESNVVSEHLHQWIDLTFGYQIKYQNAEQFDNLYHFNCYERQMDYFQEFAEDPKQIRSLQVSISEFGQIPEALFDEPHPPKNLRHEFLILDRFVPVQYERSNPKTSLIKKIGFETCKQGIFVWTQSSVEFKKSYINQNYSFDEQHKVLASSGDYSRLISFEDQCWLTLNQGILRIYLKKILKFQQTIEANCIDIIGTYFIFAKKSSLLVTQYDGVNSQLINKKVLYGHKHQIIHISCSKPLDLILSVDLYGFVLMHELQNMSFLRHFQVPLQKEWSQASFLNNSPKKHIFKVQIHEMGYFIFLLNQKKLFVVTFLGEIFLEHEIQIISETKGKRQEEKITEMLIFRHDHSLLLLGTDKGNIYEIDFIEIKRYNQIYPFKTYTNIHVNILQLLLSQHQSMMSTKSSKKLSILNKSQVEVNLQKSICHMTIEKIPGDKISFYQLIVQYEDGEIVCFYEQKYLGKKLKQNEKLKQIGLFF